MSHCWCPGKTDEASTSRCAVSGSPGVAVDRLTVKALLTEYALRRLYPGEYRFCPDAGCAVVYFTADGRQFTTAEVRVPVWQKLPFGERPICYCFGESEASIRSEFESAGRPPQSSGSFTISQPSGAHARSAIRAALATPAC